MDLSNFNFAQSFVPGITVFQARGARRRGALFNATHLLYVLAQ